MFSRSVDPYDTPTSAAVFITVEKCVISDDERTEQVQIVTVVSKPAQLYEKRRIWIVDSFLGYRASLN